MDNEQWDNKTVFDPDPMEARLAQLERRLRTLERAQRTLDAHLTALENSLVFRLLRRVGRPFIEARAKLESWPAASPVRRWFPAIFQVGSIPYSAWTEQEDGREPPTAGCVSFSLLIPVDSSRRDWLEEAVASVRAQGYSRWDLQLCEASSPVPWLTEVVDTLADSRIRVSACGSPGSQVSDALNHAARCATGDYLMVLPSHGRLAPDALQW